MNSGYSKVLNNSSVLANTIAEIEFNSENITSSGALSNKVKKSFVGICTSAITATIAIPNATLPAPETTEKIIIHNLGALPVTVTLAGGGSALVDSTNAILALAYNPTTTNWNVTNNIPLFPQTLQATLIGTNNIGSSMQGSAITACDGNTLAVGAEADGTNNGAVWIFVRSGTIWTQQVKLIGLGTERLGTSLSLSSDANILIIGAPTNGGTDGRVVVFKRSGTTWTQEASITVGIGGEGFGSSVDLDFSGTVAVIGAPNQGPDRGRIYIYSKISGIWTQRTFIAGDSGGDLMGTSVAISGDGSTVVSGSPGAAGGGTARGNVKVYSYDGATTATELQSIDGGIADNDNFGQALSMSGDGIIFAVGSPDFDTGGTNSGRASIYQRNGLTWINQLNIDGSTMNDAVGTSISISNSGTTLAVGSIGVGGGNTGQAQVFIKTDSSWSSAKLTVVGNTGSDNLGQAVALTGDGRSVAIGVPTSGVGSTRIYT